MIPITPVIRGYEMAEVVFAKDQPQYQPLPALPVDDYVITRWRLNWLERLRALFIGDLYLTIKTFKQPLQPIRMSLSKPVIVDTRSGGEVN